MGIWEQSRRIYGYRRIKAELIDIHGQRVNKKPIQIMAEKRNSGLPRRRKGRPNKAHQMTVTGLVESDFGRSRPDSLWMSDGPSTVEQRLQW